MGKHILITKVFTNSFAFIIASIIIVGLLLMQDVEAEIIGGIVGGLVVVLATVCCGWWYPKLKQWIRNRAYHISLSFSGKAKTVQVGERGFSVALEMKSQRGISEIYLTFLKAKSSGHAEGNVVSFKKLEVDDMTNLPYPSSIEVHGSRTNIRFTPFRCIKKADKLNFMATIDAKTAWTGRFAFEAREENGNEIQITRKFKIIGSKQSTPDTLEPVITIMLPDED